jgi:F-type H+-transporting ATPase subunit b
MEHFPIYPAIFMQIAGFFVLFWLLKTFFFGPIGHVVADRERIVRERIDEAEANRVKMTAAREDYEKRIAEIENEARSKIQAATKEAHEAREKLLSDARADADRLVEKGKLELDQERKKVEVTLRDKVVDLAILAAGRIIEKNLDANAHRTLVDDILNDVK